MPKKFRFVILAIVQCFNTEATQVATGYAHTCAVLNDYSVKCWGDGDQGQLGQESEHDIGESPGEMGANLKVINLGSGKKAKQVAAGHAHTCALLNDDSVKCWGEHSWLGQGSKHDIGDSPYEMGVNLAVVNIGSKKTAKQVATGDVHTCAVLNDNSVKCWGKGNQGQLGQGSVRDIGDSLGEMGDNLTAINLGSGKKAKQVATGFSHTCAVLNDDSVKCWGSGFGLGQGSPHNIGASPGQMGENLPAIDFGQGKTVVQVAAGDKHTCAVLNDYSVKCWGSGFFGQLGQGSKYDIGNSVLGEMGEHLAVIDLGIGKTAKQVAAGTDHTCAVLNDGSVKCWGRGNQGQLGQGSRQDIGDSPGEMGENLAVIDLGSGKRAKQVATGNLNTCAVLNDDSVKCWGDGLHGKLGQGSKEAIGEVANLTAIDLWGVTPVPKFTPIDLIGLTTTTFNVTTSSRHIPEIPKASSGTTSIYAAASIAVCLVLLH